MDLPYMRLYPTDIIGDVRWRALSDVQRTALLCLLMAQHQLGGVLPTDPVVLRELAQVRAEWSTVWTAALWGWFERVEGGIAYLKGREHTLESLESRKSRQRGAEITNAKRRAENALSVTPSDPLSAAPSESPSAAPGATPPSPAPAPSPNASSASAPQTQKRASRAAAPPPSLPLVLDVPQFRAAWDEWMAYRAERKLPKYQNTSVAKQYAVLAAWGLAGALASIDTAIRNGNQGLFPPPVGLRAAPSRDDALSRYPEMRASP